MGTSATEAHGGQRATAAPAGERALGVRQPLAGRILAMMMILGGVVLLPSTLTLSGPGPRIYAVGGAAIAIGAASLALPWRRVGAVGVHALLVIGIVLVVAAGWASQSVLYAWFLVLPVSYAAYVFLDRRLVAAYLLGVLAALAAPLVHSPDLAGVIVRQLAVAFPSLVLAAAVMSYLRGRLEEQRRRLSELARSDALTGIGNHRALRERLQRAVSFHARHERRCAVMLIDLDRFKRINDEHGHPEGDRVLSAVAEALQRASRREDASFRHGGDEFAMLLWESDRDDAEALAARVEAQLAKIEPPPGHEPISCAWGVAVYPVDGETGEALMACADERLMRGKDAAR